MRIPIVAGNWKMNKLHGESVMLAQSIASKTAGLEAVEVVVCPVSLSLAAVAEVLSETEVGVGAQNCYFETSGAYTGEIAPEMIKSAGCGWCIVGHSERRQIFSEDDATINAKLRLALEADLSVMFCVGETLEEREAIQMEDVLRRQIHDGLAGLSESDFADVVIAYEPVWAIGTGVTASPEQAQTAHAFIRGLVRDEFGETVAESLRIQYGGSVKPDNAEELMAQPDVDGALVGGASLDAGSFAAIVEAAAQVAAA